jgi:hypothetical protein
VPRDPIPDPFIKNQFCLIGAEHVSLDGIGVESMQEADLFMPACNGIPVKRADGLGALLLLLDPLHQMLIRGRPIVIGCFFIDPIFTRELMTVLRESDARITSVRNYYEGGHPLS